MANRDKIVAGLHEAIAFARGEPTGARITMSNTPHLDMIREMQRKQARAQADEIQRLTDWVTFLRSTLTRAKALIALGTFPDSVDKDEALKSLDTILNQ